MHLNPKWESPNIHEDRHNQVFDQDSVDEQHLALRRGEGEDFGVSFPDEGVLNRAEVEVWGELRGREEVLEDEARFGGDLVFGEPGQDLAGPVEEESDSF